MAEHEKRIAADPRTPARLRRIAEEHGTTPDALLRKVLRETETYPEAARTLGVSLRTLQNWRKRLGVAVTRVTDKGRFCPACRGTGMVMVLREVGEMPEYLSLDDCEHPEGSSSNHNVPAKPDHS